MNWYYSRMFKSQAAAREQNRREQRRLDLEMEEKRAGHLYNMEAVRREQREIERELDKIRQGAHKKPVYVDVFSHHIRKSTRTHIISIVSPTKPHERTINYKGTHRGNDLSEKQRHKIEEEAILEAWVYLQNHPDALNQNMKPSDSQSDQMATKHAVHKYRHGPEFLSQIPAELQQMFLDPSEHQPATGPNAKPTEANVKPSNISHSLEMQVNLLNLPNFKSDLRGSDCSTMYEPTTSVHCSKQSESHFSQNLDHFLICIPENGVLTSPSPRLKYPDFKIRDQECETIQITEAKDQRWSSTQPTLKEPPSSSSKPTRRDLRELANINMQAVRENISRRLSTGVEGSKGPTSTRRQSVSVDATNRPLLLSEGATNLGATDLGKDKRSQLKAPITITYEQERYNPDGSLRTVHQLPDQQKSWEEAQKARYIRSREKREHETELTIDEIFNKSND